MPRPLSKRAITPAKLAALWTPYTAFRAKQLAASTIKIDYARTASAIARLPKSLASAVEIRDWLLSCRSAEHTRRLIQQFNACCEWACGSEPYDRNPFLGMAKQLRVTKNHENLWTAFEAEERDIIIQAFEDQDPFYVPWVKFLFWTGCRPAEAAALKWENIKLDLSEIHFAHAAPIGCEVQKTKTKRDRFFPVNNRLRIFLIAIRPSAANREEFVFFGEKGGRMEYHNFQQRHWKPLVEGLVKKGEVFRYMPQYHCRHTWITLALDHMSVSDCAYFSGNSPDIIYKHYASRKRDTKIPEF